MSTLHAFAPNEAKFYSHITSLMIYNDVYVSLYNVLKNRGVYIVYRESSATEIMRLIKNIHNASHKEEKTL